MTPTPFRRAGLAAVLVLTCLVLAAHAADKPDPKKPKHPANHLARESSPYLLQHAHNPVDWYPWGEEAFAKAKKENKIVFLSIGYSSCHWCHVMERESFSNEDVAKILNEHFVCIKVDREERPDIDTVYMTALHVYGERGGWPLSMFLTPDGKPIFGGTYFPREDRVVEGTTYIGFMSLAKRVHDLHTKKGDELKKQADLVAKKTAEVMAGSVRGLALVDVNRDLVGKVVEGIREEFDKVHGGFGSAARDFKGTKFPTPPYLRLLQYEAARPKPPKGLDTILSVTLDHMARGGIYDQLGGGFARYSTERTWTVPHFEKMLYDNGQLMEVYADAYRRDPQPAYKRVIDETLAFLAREMTHPEGGFYSALDADSEDEEGKFYVWTAKEIDAVLADKEAVNLFKRVYGVDAGPNFEEKYHILVLPKPLSERAADLKMKEEELVAKLAPLRQKLFEARSKRERPLLDTKVLTSWNGEMIAGCALAGAALKEPKYTAAGAKAAEFVLSKLQTKDGRLLRTYGAAPGQKAEAKLNAFLDDYAFFVHGLLNLHDATGEAKWLDEAKRLTDVMVKHHHDEDVGGFFYTAHDHEKLFARGKDSYDGAQPSGNSMAARNLVRLWIKTKDERYRKLAEKTFHTFATHLDTRSTALATMAEALAMYLDAQKAK